MHIANNHLEIQQYPTAFYLLDTKVDFQGMKIIFYSWLYKYLNSNDL